MKYMGPTSLASFVTIVKSAISNKQDRVVITGLIKGNGSSLSAAVAGTDYAVPTADIAATLTTSWTGSSAPYTQTISGLTGVTADSKLDVGLAETATDAQYTAAVAAQIRATGSGTGTVTFKAHGTKPTVALPIIVRVVS